MLGSGRLCTSRDKQWIATVDKRLDELIDGGYLALGPNFTDLDTCEHSSSSAKHGYWCSRLDNLKIKLLMLSNVEALRASRRAAKSGCFSDGICTTGVAESGVDKSALDSSDGSDMSDGHHLIMNICQ